MFFSYDVTLKTFTSLEISWWVWVSDNSICDFVCNDILYVRNKKNIDFSYIAQHYIQFNSFASYFKHTTDTTDFVGYALLLADEFNMNQ